MDRLADRRGYSLTFWAVFFGLVLIPLLALGIELGRYYYARAEVAKAADAAALAAAAEISQRVFIESGDLQPTPRTWANAQAFASLNNASLAQYGIAAIVTGIQVDAAADMVLVTVTADVSGLFPSVLPRVLISESAQARVRGVGGGGG